ncbi:MAG: aldo/keto reductase [Kiritimatiellae bacterium]|nr:aldo/keto reductase [Kiritimatiellia bacterium]
MKSKTKKLSTPNLSRRSFLASSLAGLGVATADVAKGRVPDGPMTLREDPHGRKVSLLGYGAMRLPTVDGGHANNWAKAGYSGSSIDQKTLNAQIKYLLEHGVNYFDTSPAYCRGESETCLGNALAASGYARADYILATKLSNFAPQQYPLDKCKEMFEHSLKCLRTDYIDYYLLHAIGNGGFATFSKRYLENGALDWCVGLRAAGRIRNLGFSFHGDPNVFEWCLEHHGEYKWDFCQIQMNYVDWRHAKEVNTRNLNAEYLYERLTKLRIPVVIMEPLLGGRLARYNYALSKELTPLDPDATLAKWALRFCGTYPNVMTILSGMTETKFIEENIATCSPLKPCSAAELATLERAAQALLKLNTIPCNDCKYCMPCPYGLDIPAILTFRNVVLTAKTPPTDRETLKMYAAAVPDELRRADHCIGCGKCRPHCPQTIDIPKELAQIDAWVDTLKNKEAAR